MVAPKEKQELAPDAEQGRYRRAWRESHGTPLMGFAAFILVVGMFLIYSAPPEPNGTEINLTAGAGTSDAPPMEGDVLLVRVTSNKTESDGPILIAVYSSKESFGNPDEAVTKKAFIPEQGVVAWPISLDILPEQFAIAAFHDEDSNGELNHGLFNMPSEPYGFSNDARNMMGPPVFEDTLVQKPTESTVIEVRVY